MFVLAILVNMVMSRKKCDEFAQKVKHLLRDEESLQELVDILKDVFGIEKGLEQHRERQRLALAKAKETEGTTYSESDRRYYQQNKEKLNKKRAVSMKESRQAVRDASHSDNLS
jgi:hypothetical protein